MGFDLASKEDSKPRNSRNITDLALLKPRREFLKIFLSKLKDFLWIAKLAR
jgi:hypothetical protein